MITEQQAKAIIEAYKAEICNLLYIDKDWVHINLVNILPSIGQSTAFSIVDPTSRTISISNELVVDCCQNYGFTKLRFEVYTCVRMLYLKFHPDKCKGDILLESSYYSHALLLLKGLSIPLPPQFVASVIPNVVRVLNEEFHFHASVPMMQTAAINGTYSYKATLSGDDEKRYLNRYHPLPSKSTVNKLVAGDKGTKENPCENIYEAVKLIKQMEEEAHERDALLKEIEQQKFFYDTNYNQFRIHWASPYVAQYKNNLPTRSFMVNQMESLSPNQPRFFSFKPNLYGHKFLYRGQSNDYEGKPCVPNLFRDKAHNDKRNFLDFLIFSQEMELLIMSHPLVRLLDKGVDLLHDFFHFRMHVGGLCQHYYNKSRYLDLTSDLEVMKFFATTDYRDEKYFPHTDTSNLGVIYCYELQYPEAFQPHKGYALKTIGKQMFMRPGAQCGFLLEMGFGVDFKRLPEVTPIYFRHDPKISEEIFKQSKSGEEYFATDLLQKAWEDRFRQRYNDRVVSFQTVELNAKRNKTTTADIKNKLAELGIKVDDSVPSFNQEELDIYYTDIKNGWWRNFCEDIHFYGAEDELYRQALRELPEKQEYRRAFEKDL